MDIYWWAWLIPAAPLCWALLIVPVLRVVQMGVWRGSLTALEIRLPRDTPVEQVGRWVGALRAIMRARRWWSPLPCWPIGLEITATHTGIRRIILVPDRLRAAVHSSLLAVIPGARLDEQAHYFTEQSPSRWRLAAEVRLVGSSGLLATDLAEDVSRHIVAALQPLHSGETLRLQWLLAGAPSPRFLLRTGLSKQDVTTLVGAQWAEGKPVLYACCRLAVASAHGGRRARALARRIWAGLRGLNTPRVRLVRRWVPGVLIARRLAGRMVPVRRWGLVATAGELGGLLGLATGVNALPGNPAAISRTIAPSPLMPKAGLVLAASNYPGSTTALSLSREDRLRHVWMLGPTGTGKSTLLTNAVGYDINHGDGVTVIDARGDLVGDIIDRIPDNRADDLIVIDPTISDYVIGINPLQAGEPEQAAGFVYHVLQSVYASSWGPRTADIVRACLLTLTATRGPHGERFTLIDIPELLTNTAFRRWVTSQPLSPYVGKFWTWYESLGETNQLTIISPVLNKLRTFTLSTPLRLLLGQSDGIRFADAIADKRIVLVALKKGLLGQETSALIGSLVMASVWQATLSRANTPNEKRHPYWLYIDEFQNVVRLPIDLADMLSEARGLGLGVTLAHQYVGQLTPHVKDAVMGTTRTHLAFQLLEKDATHLATGFAPLTYDDLHHLGPYEVALRPCVNGATLTPMTGRTLPAPEPCRDGAVLAEYSRRQYGKTAETVEQQILDRLTIPKTSHKANRIVIEERS